MPRLMRLLRRWSPWCALLILVSSLACGGRGARIPEPRQIILVSFDTLRADHVGPWREDPAAWKATPNLDAFARDAVVFKNALSTATSTTQAHKSIFYGLYSHTHRTTMLRYPIEERVTAPVDVLRRSGLQTAAMACLGAINEQVGLAHGFDEVDWRRCVYREVTSDLPTLTKTSFPWLRSHAENEYFVFLHTYRTHTPHDPGVEVLRRVGRRHGLSEDWPPPENVLNRANKHWMTEVDSPQAMSALRALYEADVETADAWFGRLVRHLERLGTYESAVVIVLADHGESLGEDGYVGHSQMADEQTFVPLMMKIPGVEPREISDPVSLVDVMPTLFDLLDLEPPFEFQGESLVPVLNGNSRLPEDRLRIVEQVSQVGLYRGPWKLQFDRDRGESPILTQWRDDDAAPQGLDETERRRVERDLLRMYGAVLKEAQPLANRFILDPRKGSEFSEDTLGELRALGYIE